jgi:hypothetical protein
VEDAAKQIIPCTLTSTVVDVCSSVPAAPYIDPYI